MRHKEILKLLIGFRKFREQYFRDDKSLYNNLSTGQAPKTLIIGCCDSRTDPAIISGASPGEIFVVRNVANLVPPFEKGGGHHGVSAAIEFAVQSLKVENIVILGHRQCGGIRALVAGDPVINEGFVGQWMKIASPAKEKILKKYPGESIDIQCRHCEMESILLSIENLKTFPFVQEALTERGINIIGIYFDLESGELHEFKEGQGFVQIQ